MKKHLIAFCCIFMIVFTQAAAFADGAPKAVMDVRSSVVRIVVDTPFGEAYGTGFAVGSQKPVQYIVTNYHVVDGAEKISILLSRDNLIEATVKVSLPASDLAVLYTSIPLHNVEPAVINDKPARVGSKGYALGYPYAASELSQMITGNQEDITVTDGIIGALQTVPYIANLEPVSVYQINVALNPGNSGGPFVNSKGEVIGINSWGVDGADGVNAAIRVEELTKVLSQNGIKYIKAQNLTLVWVILILAMLLVIAAVIFLIVILIKKNKQPKAVLYGIGGEFAGQRFYLPPEGVNIGRDAAICQIVLPFDSPKVSRSHCNVRYNPVDRVFILTDLSSANGTFLANGTRLQPKVPTIVKAETKFYLGDETTMFRAGLED